MTRRELMRLAYTTAHLLDPKHPATLAYHLLPYWLHGLRGEA